MYPRFSRKTRRRFLNKSAWLTTGFAGVECDKRPLCAIKIALLTGNRAVARYAVRREVPREILVISQALLP